MLPRESASYLQFLIQRDTKLDDGEASALAIAFHRNAHLVTDDGAAQKKALSHGVAWSDSAAFVRAVVPKQLHLL